MSIHQSSPQVDSLVLYKSHPARVVALGEKIEIELSDRQTKRVRPKDIALLHPGPLRSLTELEPCEGEIEEAWALLEGGDTDLKELTELVFDRFTPAGCWAVWQQVASGDYFTGTPAEIQVRSREEVERNRAARAAREAAEADWRAFLERMQRGQPIPEDRERLAEVERLALGQSERSRILQALGHQETPQHAHRALIQVGHWSADHNPYPARAGVVLTGPDLPVQDLPEEARRDLTHLPAFAIDDEDNQDPDDALSLDGDRLWVHVADVAALVSPEGPLEREARSRGANLYLPEGIVSMLPAEITRRLGLGLQDVSPALSFGFRCSSDGEPCDLLVEPTWIRVERLSYEWVEERLDEPPFAAMQAFLSGFRARREAQQAAQIELPEVNIRVSAGTVAIRPIGRLRSRGLVADAMLMAGEAVARFCLEQGIPIPFAMQPPPDKAERPAGLAEMYAYRRRFKPTRLTLEPQAHAGLGLPMYTRTTSPLRRYSDLLVHQQLRCWLRGETLLGAEEVTLRVGEAEAASALVRRAERLSNQHWKLVYLRDNPAWRGEAVVVEAEDHKSTVLIPDLAMEARLRLRGDVRLNDRVRLVVRDVDLPDLTAFFGVK